MRSAPARLRRPGEPAGGVEPRRRLPVTPGGLAARLPRPGGFPYAAPPWPDGVPRPARPAHLGVGYDTEWARRLPARTARRLLIEAVTRPVVTAVAAPRVSGLDRIADLRAPAIFAANHASHVDTPLLVSVLPERWRHRVVVAGAADYFFDTRVKAALLALTLNAVPIERRRVDRLSVNRLAALIADGWSLVIFPEGGRSPDGWGQAHGAGAAWLAARTGRPVVPIHVAGTRHILPRGGRRVRPGRAEVRFGRPLRAVEGNARELSQRVERAIAALADEAATDWWSATRRAAAGRTPPLTGPGAVGAWRRAWALGDAGAREPASSWPRR